MIIIYSCKYIQPFSKKQFSSLFVNSEESIFISIFFKEFGQKVKDFRLNKGLTLEQLGFEIGLDKSAMFHIESGKPITMTTFLKIAKALNIQPKELIPDILI